jgi:hypothetical protein
VTIEQRPMRADEFPAWKIASVAAYAGLYRSLGYDEVAVYMGKTL